MQMSFLSEIIWVPINCVGPAFKNSSMESKENLV